MPPPPFKLTFHVLPEVIYLLGHVNNGASALGAEGAQRTTLNP
jgi:hypothetical protein